METYLISLITTTFIQPYSGTRHLLGAGCTAAAEQWWLKQVSVPYGSQCQNQTWSTRQHRTDSTLQPPPLSSLARQQPQGQLPWIAALSLPPSLWKALPLAFVQLVVHISVLSSNVTSLGAHPNACKNPTFLPPTVDTVYPVHFLQAAHEGLTHLFLLSVSQARLPVTRRQETYLSYKSLKP